MQSYLNQAESCLCLSKNGKKRENCNYLIWSDIVLNIWSKSLSLPVPQPFCSAVIALLSWCVNGVRGVIYSAREKRYADLETSSQ